MSVPTHVSFAHYKCQNPFSLVKIKVENLFTIESLHYRESVETHMNFLCLSESVGNYSTTGQPKHAALTTTTTTSVTPATTKGSLLDHQSKSSSMKTPSIASLVKGFQTPTIGTNEGYPFFPGYPKAFGDGNGTGTESPGSISTSPSPFVTPNSTVVKAQFKGAALLPCHVHNSGDGVTVSTIFS